MYSSDDGAASDSNSSCGFGMPWSVGYRVAFGKTEAGDGAANGLSSRPDAVLPALPQPEGENRGDFASSPPMAQNSTLKTRRAGQRWKWPQPAAKTAPATSGFCGRS